MHDEILRFKLDAARRRLQQAGSHVAEIAVSCGFTSVQYLHAVFKRELGCTPREYQEQAANGDAVQPRPPGRNKQPEITMPMAVPSISERRANGSK